MAIKKNADYNLHQTSHRVYGFLADSTKSVGENTRILLEKMTPHEYYTRPGNMAFHNLCTTAKPPPGTAALLGLGLKYCIESPRPYQDLDSSLHRFRRDMRLHCCFNLDATTNKDESTKEEEYIPRLYIPSKWQPPLAPTRFEFTFDDFDKVLTDERRSLPWTRRFNLTPSQRHVLSELTKRPDLIVLPTDKNLGPCVIERKIYIEQVLKEHLLQQKNYERLSPEIAKIELQKQRTAFLSVYTKYKHTLPTKAEATYFSRAMTEEYLNATRVPQFYGTFKVHKPDKKMRPVISCVNSIPEIFSKWIDHHLKTLVESNLLPTYMKDSRQLQQSLLKAFPNGLPPNARLFSVDAVSMYSNIDTAHGLQVIAKWFRLYKADLPQNFPSAMLNAALELVMSDNILQFGDTFWRQLCGTAMGTSTAVNYANLYVGLLEVTRLLRKFKNQLLFYRRFIDDGVGIWLCDDPLIWASFLECLNTWGSLKWTSDGLTDEIIFMDLRIKIDPFSNQLVYETYQKSMNLYLYIPPNSAHQHGVLRSLIFGRIQAYWHQNTEEYNFVKMAALLAQRLIARGHSRQILTPLFVEATERFTHLDSKNQQGAITAEPAAAVEDIKPIFFHLPYHPRGIQRTTIRKTFDATLKKVLPHRPLIVAVSRPKNLGDRVCRTRLPDVPGNNPSDLT